MATDKRIPSLDGLRAISILLVLASHSNRSPGYPAALAWLGSWSKLGVLVFFVISGYLITLLLLDEEARNGRISLREFYIRRVFRIIPAYWTYILSVALLSITGVIEILPMSFVTALTFTTHIIPVEVSWELGHTWTLALEEIFYLCWPVTFLLTRGPLRLYVGPVLMIALPLLRITKMYLGPPDVVFNMPLFQGDAMVFGSFAALALRQWPQLVGRLVVFAPGLLRTAAIVFLFAFGYFFGKKEFPAITGPFGITIIGLLATYITVSVTQLRSGAVYAFLNWQPALD